MESKVQQMQNLYGEWVKLLPELEKGLRQWRQAAEIMQQLKQFYFSSEWQTLYDNADEIPLDTQGNYSVLSEDALWNAFHEQHQLAVQWLKEGIAVIDNR